MGDVPRLPTSSFALLLTATLHATMCATPCAQDAATGAPSPPPPTELRYGDAGRLAARLVGRPWDPEHARATCKVYHHLFAPDGRLLTKGEGGTFEHHRGLFVGWNRTGWRGQRLDFWHLGRGETQRLRGFADPAVLGLGPRAQVAEIDWCAPDGEVVVHETRGVEVTAHDDEHYVLQMRVRLVAASDPVELTGDPQHAGQQLRLLQRFADEGHEPVRYVRPADAASKGDDVWAGCAWTAAVLPLPDGPVTVLRVEPAAADGDARWSTRPYGRFGAMLEAKLTRERPLLLEQRYVVALGERDDAWCAALAATPR